MIDNTTEERLADLSNCSTVSLSEVASFNSSNDYSVSKFNEYALHDFKKNTPVFLRMVREENFESGYTNNIDNLVDNLIQKDPMVALLWLNDIYVNYYSDTKVLLAVLFTISRIENNIIRQSLITMAIAGLAHNDIEVRETAIRCFENWGDVFSLRCLKRSMSDPIKWIEEYKQQVVLDIEKTLN